MSQDGQNGLFGDEPERRRRRLAPKQADQAEASRRGRERQNIRHADFGNSHRKALMYTLDDHILSLPGYRLTIKTLARNANVRLKSTYKFLKDLAEKGLISYGKVAGTTSLYWFRIHHCNVPDCIGRPWGEVEPEAEDEEDCLEAEGPIETLDDEAEESFSTANDSLGKNVFSFPEKPFLPERKVFSPRETAPLIRAHQSPPPPLTPPDETHDRWEEVEDVLIRLGVGLVTEAIDAARSAGYAPSRVLEIATVFESKPGAWDVGALWHRIVRGHPRQPPEAGWPRVSKAYVRREQAAQFARSREADPKPVPKPLNSEADRLAALADRYGDELEAMADEDREALASGLERFERGLFRQNGWRSVKTRLLEILHARDGPGSAA